ncbi:four helix bundle protein [Psychroflexus sp. YR1-1]|uniref:Four helix bundle protein n=1 Tax=Psychroflexus aurantiacus TaxID=2709310 RepID=A0A6B3RBL6_9FLAO|nr:four helix bundle protein [Psychroflexus aurantiacus]
MALKHNFRKLTIWQEARSLVSETYSITEKFSKTEIYGLSNQYVFSSDTIFTY